MYSDKYINNTIEMEKSFNCCVLNSDASKMEIFPFPILSENNGGKMFVIINNRRITLVNLTVGHIRELMCPNVDVSVTRGLKLWKVNVKEEAIKNNVFTDEDIENKLNGKPMVPNKLFKRYFQDELDNKNEDEEFTESIHIITVIPTTAHPSQQGVPQVPLTSVEDILKFVLEDAIPLTSLTHTSRSGTDTSQFLNWRDMPLKDRDLSKITAFVKDNVINNSIANSSRSYAKSDFNILVCGGAPGIGKTRLGSELFDNIETNGESLFENITSFKHFEYIYLDFGNSIKLDNHDYSLDNDKIICLRILYEHFIVGKYDLDFKIFRERILPYIKILNISAVFADIRKNLLLKDTERLFIFLHIDEFQLIFKWDEDRNDKLFRYIINELAPEYMFGNSSHLTFVQGFFSGTARQAAVREKEASKLTLEHIKCPMLSVKSMIQIVDFYAEEYGAKKINGEYSWKLCIPFLQIIQDTGGLPRALQYMLISCFQGKNEDGFFNMISEQNFENISRTTADKLQNLYGIYATIKENMHLAHELLYHCVMGKLVTPEECLDPNDKTRTIENLETDTHIILKESDQRDYFYIEMPFLFLVLYNDILRIVPIKLGETFNVNYTMYWQSWELFVAYYEAFINNMLIECEKKTEVTLRELYRGAHGKDVTLNKIVKLKKLSVCQSLQRFPCPNLSSIYDNNPIRWEEGNDIIVNGKGASFGDSFVAREMLYDPENSNTLMIVQDKWDYDGEVLTKLEVLKECIKNLKSLVKESETIIKHYPDPCCITILVTTRRCDFDHEQLPEDVLVIDKINFEKYFGRVFSSRTVFCLAKDINPNFSELTKIKNIIPNVGEITAGKIVEKRPYLNLDDFLGKHKRVKREKLDEANINLDFFPFDL